MNGRGGLEFWSLLLVVLPRTQLGSSRHYTSFFSILGNCFSVALLSGKDFRTTPYINYTCITVVLTLFQNRIKFESQNACMINVWGCAEILPFFSLIRTLSIVKTFKM